MLCSWRCLGSECICAVLGELVAVEAERQAVDGRPAGRAAPVGAAPRIRRIKEVAVRVEESDVVGGADCPVAEQRLVLLASSLESGLVERPEAE